jgi:hypothetical protein
VAGAETKGIKWLPTDLGRHVGSDQNHSAILAWASGRRHIGHGIADLPRLWVHRLRNLLRSGVNTERQQLASGGPIR